MIQLGGQRNTVVVLVAEKDYFVICIPKVARVCSDFHHTQTLPQRTAHTTRILEYWRKDMRNKNYDKYAATHSHYSSRPLPIFPWLRWVWVCVCFQLCRVVLLKCSINYYMNHNQKNKFKFIVSIEVAAFVKIQAIQDTLVMVTLRMWYIKRSIITRDKKLV